MLPICQKYSNYKFRKNYENPTSIIETQHDMTFNNQY